MASKKYKNLLNEMDRVIHGMDFLAKNTIEMSRDRSRKQT
jgi:hypothetical protein